MLKIRLTVELGGQSATRVLTFPIGRQPQGD
jgi:hypothetical protein